MFQILGFKVHAESKLSFVTSQTIQFNTLNDKNQKSKNYSNYVFWSWTKIILAIARALGKS